MPSSAREARILERLQQVCAYAYAHSSFYRSKWNEAGFHPSHLKSLEDFEAKVPVVQKKDLRAAMQRMLDSKEPYLLDVIVPYTEHVLPFIPGGKTVAEMIWKA